MDNRIFDEVFQKGKFKDWQGHKAAFMQVGADNHWHRGENVIVKEFDFPH